MIKITNLKGLSEKATTIEIQSIINCFVIEQFLFGLPVKHPSN